MALFKILKGTVTNFNKVDANGNPNVPIREGYCYVTTDEKHMYIDISSDERICLEAEWADHAHMLGNSVMGSPTSPIYLSTDGVPAQCERLLPLSAGVNNKLTGALGLPKTTMYGPTLPSSGFDGQLFFLEDSGAALPTGGSAGQALVKNTATDGDASWKSSSISWAAGTSNGPQPKIFGVTGSAIPAASGSASGIVTTGAQTFAGEKTFANGIQIADNMGITGRMAGGSDWWTLTGTGSDDSGVLELRIADNASTDYFDIIFQDWDTENVPDFRAIRFGKTRIDAYTKLYGAVWNDYAEFRNQKNEVKPGYCVASANDGKVYKTTEHLQACDGIVSDTYGFSIGETDDCKTPLAVSGRVLAYCEGNAHDYNAGDTVGASANGKVIKMTREEIKEYPDRIVGIVSEIPEYETWGTGKVNVDGRIWIKVK